MEYGASPSAEARALGDPEFSDCILRLCLDAGTSLLSPLPTSSFPPAADAAPAPTSTHSPLGPLTRTTQRGRDSTILNTGEGRSSTVPKKVLREVPVCTLVLAAKSEYFRILFTGRFAESARRERVDIHVPEGGESAFMDLLFYLYNGAMPGYLAHSVEATLKLLAISDLFETRDCFQECLGMLMEGLRTLKARDALLFINLPPQLQDRPSLAPLVTAGKRCLVKEYSKYFKAPYREAFFSLTEQVLCILLDSDDLEVESEDQVLEGAKVWVTRNFAEGSAAVEALCRVVLPRVRHLSLSPRALLSLVLWEKETFFGVPNSETSDSDVSDSEASQIPSSGHFNSACTSPESSPPPPLLPSFFLSPHTPSPLSLSLSPPHVLPLSQSQSPPLYRRRTGQNQGVRPEDPQQGVYQGHTTASASASASEAAVYAHEVSLSALLALSERCFLDTGCVPGGGSFGGCMTGRQWTQPRVSCRPPSGRLYLDIPLQFCQPWLPQDEDLAASALTFVSGRWLELKAKYHSTPGTVGLWVTWHTDPAVSKREQWRAKCRFCVMTESSSPAYQTLQCTDASFEVEVASWGLEGALSMGTILQEAEYFFPEGALRIRADIWVLS